MAYSKVPVNGLFDIPCAFGEENPRYKCGYHTGVDIVNDDRIVYSPTFGIIYKIGYDASYGNYVVIADDTPNDVHFHWLCHLSKVECSIGEKVEPSTRIGIMGNTGKATGIHLHYEIRNNSLYDVNGKIVDNKSMLTEINDRGDIVEEATTDESIYIMK